MDLLCQHLLIMAAVWSASAAPSFTTDCNQEIGCDTGFYCETNFVCTPCLRCQDLKRKLPPTSMSCVTSVLECGSCIDGFKEDRITAECITPIEKVFPTWTIVVIVVASLLFALICAITAYLLRNLLYFKIFASTTIHPPCENNVEQASAPPPYNYVALLPKEQPLEATTSPSYNAVAVLPKAQPVEASLPFIQAVPSECNSGKREPMERQAARVFRDPSYLRNPEAELIPIYEIPISGPAHESLREHQEEHLDNDVRTNYHEPIRVFQAIEQPPIDPPAVRVRQDSNNSTQTEEDEESAHSFFNTNCAPFIFNVVNNVTTVQQNDVTI